MHTDLFGLLTYLYLYISHIICICVKLSVFRVHGCVGLVFFKNIQHFDLKENLHFKVQNIKISGRSGHLDTDLF